MVIGRAEKLTNHGEMLRAMKQIVERNPSLTPGISATQLDASRRAVDYRAFPHSTGGNRREKNRMMGFF